MFVKSVLYKLQKEYPDFSFKKFAGEDNKITPNELVVYLLVAGYEEANAAGRFPAVWAHASGSNYSSDDLVVYTSTDKTLSLSDWAMQGELSTYNKDTAYPMPTTGTMCHELGHQICRLPDLYDTSSYNSGVGMFSLMAGGTDGAVSGDSGGSRPCNLDAWSRYYLGWETPTVIDGTYKSDKLTIPSQSYSANSGLLMIKGPASLPYQYYLMEVRNAVDVDDNWDAGLQDFMKTAGTKGVLVQHIDETVGSGKLEDGNDFNQYKDGDNILNPHQGNMVVCPYEDSRHAVSTDMGSQESLWYSGNAKAKANGITASSAIEYLKSLFFSDTSAAKGNTETGINLLDFSAPADTMTCSYSVNKQGGGSGGCSAAAWPILLVFAAVPFAVKRRRK